MLKAHINGHGFIKDFLKSGSNNSGIEFTNTLEEAQVFTMKTQVDYVVASAGIPVVNITFIGEEGKSEDINEEINELRHSLAWMVNNFTNPICLETKDRYEQIKRTVPSSYLDYLDNKRVVGEGK